MNTNSLKNRRMRVFTLMLTMVSVFLLGISMQSCSNEQLFENDSFDIEKSIITGIGITDFKDWLEAQQIENGLIKKDRLDWGNAKIKMSPDGKSLSVSLIIFQGKNSLENDSIRELQIAYINNDFKGGVLVYTFYNKERAFVNYYNLRGQLWIEGAYYAPKQVFSLLKIYPVERTHIRLKTDPEGEPCQYDEEANSATPYNNPDGTPNSEAYNCHYWVWGAGTSVQSNPYYEPGHPNWNNCPNTSGYNVVNTPQVGDRWVSYGFLPNGDRVAVHSAIIIEVANGRASKVQAKCGEEGIRTYDPDTGCSMFSGYKTNEIKYYREE